MAQATNTELTVRVQARGGMFLGPDSYNGAIITINDGSQILAGPAFTDNGDSGKRSTKPGPGDSPYKIITPGSPPKEHFVVASATTVEYAAKIYLSKTTLLNVEARVPLPAAQGDQIAAVNTQVSPGEPSSIVGLVIEIPGLWVQPELVVLGNMVNLKTKVTMMCGCEINHSTVKVESPWMPSDFEVKAQILRNGNSVAVVPLTFVFNSQFAGQYSPLAPGDYVAVIVARQKSTGNIGEASMAFQITGTS